MDLPDEDQLVVEVDADVALLVPHVQEPAGEAVQVQEVVPLLWGLTFPAQLAVQPAIDLSVVTQTLT